ncbi:hypothetical protein HK104_000742, partial [Borealophlyctis nickersoniae]
MSLLPCIIGSGLYLPLTATPLDPPSYNDRNTPARAAAVGLAVRYAERVSRIPAVRHPPKKDLHSEGGDEEATTEGGRSGWTTPGPWDGPAPSLVRAVVEIEGGQEGGNGARERVLEWVSDGAKEAGPPMSTPVVRVHVPWSPLEPYTYSRGVSRGKWLERADQVQSGGRMGGEIGKHRGMKTPDLPKTVVLLPDIKRKLGAADISAKLGDQERNLPRPTADPTPPAYMHRLLPTILPHIAAITAAAKEAFATGESGVHGLESPAAAKPPIWHHHPASSVNISSPPDDASKDGLSLNPRRY